jgi:hypothetical protein
LENIASLENSADTNFTPLKKFAEKKFAFSPNTAPEKSASPSKFVENSASLKNLAFEKSAPAYLVKLALEKIRFSLNTAPEK